MFKCAYVSVCLWKLEESGSPGTRVTGGYIPLNIGTKLRSTEEQYVLITTELSP